MAPPSTSIRAPLPTTSSPATIDTFSFTKSLVGAATPSTVSTGSSFSTDRPWISDVNISLLRSQGNTAATSIGGFTASKGLECNPKPLDWGSTVQRQSLPEIVPATGSVRTASSPFPFTEASTSTPDSEHDFLSPLLYQQSELLGQSVQKVRSAPSVAARASSIVEKEVAFQSGLGGNVRNFCHMKPGCWVNLKPMREVFRQEATMQTWRHPFSSESGDNVDVVVPPLAESIADGTLAKFLKRPGDRVNVDEAIAQIETDKVTIDVSSPESGVIVKLLANEGDTVEPGNKIAIISRSADATTHVAPSETTSQKAAPQSTPKTSEEKKAPKAEAAPKAAPATEKPKVPLASQSSPTEPQLPPKERERRVPMTRLRKRVATRLKDSQNTFAMLTTFNEVDMTNLMKLRADYKDAFVEKHGVKLGLMSGFVKAAVNALKHQPIVNAVIDGDDIIYRDYIDISIAVGTPKGLVVPVIRNAEAMNFADIEKQINAFAKKANDGTLSIDEMAGGTLTISNGGVYGSLLSTPIINPPQSAILGMHSIVSRPMVVGGNVVPRPMMYIALTYDHRIIDGREAVFFLRRIKDIVEDPRRLLLDI